MADTQAQQPEQGAGQPSSVLAAVADAAFARVLAQYGQFLDEGQQRVVRAKVDRACAAGVALWHIRLGNADAPDWRIGVIAATGDDHG